MKKRLLICAIIFYAHATGAMTDQPQTSEPDKTVTLSGVINSNQTGTLECKVTWNATRNTYSGTLYNNGYLSAKKSSLALKEASACHFYQTLSARSAPTDTAVEQTEQK